MAVFLRTRLIFWLLQTALLCRSGVRSHHAAIALTQAGYANAYNVLQGFEGDKDPSGQRNRLGGWRAAGLPWAQS